MRNKKKIASIVAGAVLCASFVGAGLLVNPVNAAGETTTTMTFDTSYRTRVTTQLSNATDYKGGSISFDLYSSTLKAEKNVADAAKCEFFGSGVYSSTTYDHFGGLGYQTFDAPNVSFAFHKDSDEMGQKAWRAAKEQADDPLYNSLTSLTYYADGRILEYTGSGDWGSARIGYLQLRGPVANPNDINFVGSADDVKAFLNEGYNYKMSWVWGHVNADKSITTATTNTEAWYVAYRKPIATADSEYQVLFAMKVGRPTAVTAGAGSYAGFEITANHYENSLSDTTITDTSLFSNYNSYGSVKNVQMEMDNVAIYDGYDYETATVKTYTDFEEGWENYETDKNQLSTVYQKDVNGDGSTWNFELHSPVAWGGLNAKYTKPSAGPCVYKVENYNTNTVTVDGLKVQSTDVAISSIEGPSKRTVNTEVQVPVKATYTITLKDGDLTVGTLTGLDGDAVTLPTTINGATYTWDQNVTEFTANMTINGTRAKNESAVLDTAFRTRVTAPLSNPTEWLGGSIEFDLLSSSLKNAENLSKVGNTDGKNVNYGAAEIDHVHDRLTEQGIYYMNYDNAGSEGIGLGAGAGGEMDQYIGRLSAATDYAHISFNFFKNHTDIIGGDADHNLTWRVGTGAWNATVNENASSFSYYADGRVVEYSGTAAAFTGASVYLRGPAYETGETFVGSQEDVDAFMNAGYSYKVSWVWGSVSADKKVTETNTNTEAWYVAYRKAIGAPTWEVLFAFKISNPDKVTASNGVQAGFEVHGNCGFVRSSGVPSTYSNNVEMEMDNVAIYDSKVKHTATFEENVNYAETQLGVKAFTADAGYQVNRNLRAWGYHAAIADSAYYTVSEVTIDGIRIQSSNAGDVAMASVSSRTYNSYDKKTIAWKVDGKTIFTTEVIAGQPLTGFAQTYTYGNYTWDLGEMDLTAPITEDIVINGEYTFGDDLDAMNVAVDSDIIARFYFNLTTELVNAENARMIVKVAGEDYDVVELANWAAGQDSRYAYEVKLAAAELTKKISMQFVTDAGEGVVYEYSVRDYADAMLAREETTQEQKNMIYAMLNYGAAAQEYFDVNVDDLANEGIENNVASVTDETIVALKNNTLVDELSTLNVASYELYLDYTAKLRVFFTKEVESVGIFEYTITVNGEEVEAYKLGDKYYIEIELAAAELDDTLEIVVTYGGETLTMTTSAASYAGYAIANASAELKNVLKAMYLYCYAANVLFNA